MHPLKAIYIYSFKECLSSVYYIPGTHISIKATLMNKLGKDCVLMELTFFAKTCVI